MSLFLDIHTHQATTQAGVMAIRNIDLNINEAPSPGQDFVSMGLHPWTLDAQSYQLNLLKLSSLTDENSTLLVGECGLDKLCKTPIELQITAFEQQILLAEKYKKPVIVHCVKAFDELLAIQKQLKPRIPLIIHGFNKSSDLAKTLIKHEFYLSFGAHLLQQVRLQQTFLALPLERVFLETDNSHNDIQSVYEIAAKLKSISIEELQRSIANNWKKMGLVD